MTRPSRPARVLASALAAGTLLTTAACADESGAPEAVSVSAAAERSPSPSATAALTGAGAQAALITPADIENDWQVATDAATWRISRLIG